MNRKDFAPILIFLLALSVRLSAWFIYELHGGNIFELDSYSYHRLAENLLEHHVYSLNNGITDTPETFVMPLYPLFLSILYRIFGIHPQIVVLVQIIIGSLTALLLLRMGRILRMEKVGLISALLFALDLPSIHYCHKLLNETLFTFLLLLGICFLFSYFYSFRNADIFTCGLCFGLLSLRHNITFYSPLIIVPFLFLGHPTKKGMVKSTAFFIIPFFLVVSPWLIRNYRNFGTIQMSDGNTQQLLYWNVAYLISAREGISLEQARDLIKIRASEECEKDGISSNPFARAKICRQLALREISKSPALYLKLQLIKGPIELFDNFGIDIFFDYFGSNLPAWAKNSIVKKQFGEVLRKYPAPAIGTLLLEGYLMMVYMSSIVGLYSLWRKNRTIFYVLAVMIICFAVTVGPIAYWRYRTPIMPYIYFLCAAGMAHMFTRIYPHLRPNHEE